MTGREFAPLIESCGFRRIPRGDEDGVSFDVPRWPNPLAVAIQVKHLEYALAEFRPDVIVTSQLALGPLIVAEMNAIPVVVQGIGTYLWERVADDDATEAEIAQRVWHEQEALRIYNEARTLLGLRERHERRADFPLLGDRYLLRSVPALCDPATLPERVRLVGGCLWEPPAHDVELDDWLAANAGAEPTAYAQIGRSFGLPSAWPALRDGLSRLPLRVAASVGRIDAEIGMIPANFFVRAHVDQASVLPHASVVIATGHATAVLGALEHGLPLLLLPNGSGSPETATACERAGVAAVLRSKAPTALEVLQHFAEVVAEPAYASRARAVAAEFALFGDSLCVAADAAADLAGTRSCVAV
ncbi:MAG: hypothetical protein M3N49_01785 [Candidatus Eremiobacteraeota bacterium]|nr:hypothetical protein [Candidatus Eremiobacteraeota bacterium]